MIKMKYIELKSLYYSSPEVCVLEISNEGMLCESYGENEKPEPWSCEPSSIDMDF